MEQDQQILLIYKSLREGLTAEEQFKLDDWLKKDAGNQEIAKQVELAWNLSKEPMVDVNIDVDEEYGRLWSRIEADQKTTAKVVKLNRWNFIAVAASIAVLLTVALFFWNQQEVINPVLVQAKEELKMIELPDGTVVWLNKSSQLQYPSKFNSDQRIVELNGEAYFEVAHLNNQPFIVKADGIDVQVLGTSFNVKDNDSDQTTEVWVESGKVQLNAKNGSTSPVLKAGTYISFDQKQQQFSKLQKLENNNHLVWKSKMYKFSDATITEIQEVLKDLGVNLALEKAHQLNCKYSRTGSIDFQTVNVEEFLSSVASIHNATLEKISETHFRILGGVPCK